MTETEVPADVQAGHDSATLAKVVALNVEVTRARHAYDRADLARKAAKEALEERQAALNDFIVAIGEEYPLFDREPPSLDIYDGRPPVEGASGIPEVPGTPDHAPAPARPKGRKRPGAEARP